MIDRPVLLGLQVRALAAEAEVALERGGSAELAREAQALLEDMLLGNVAHRLKAPHLAGPSLQMLLGFLAERYGDRADDLLALAAKALLGFGGSNEQRTPSEAIADAVDARTRLGRPPGRDLTREKWIQEYRRTEAKLRVDGTRVTDTNRATDMRLPLGTFREYVKEYGRP